MVEAELLDEMPTRHCWARRVSITGRSGAIQPRNVWEALPRASFRRMCPQQPRQMLTFWSISRFIWLPAREGCGCLLEPREVARVRGGRKPGAGPGITVVASPAELRGLGTIAVGPGRIDGIEFQKAGEQDGCDIGHSHGEPGMTGLRLLDRIHGERPDGIRHFMVLRRRHCGTLHVSCRRGCRRRGRRCSERRIPLAHACRNRPFFRLADVADDRGRRSRQAAALATASSMRPRRIKHGARRRCMRHAQAGRLSLPRD